MAVNAAVLGHGAGYVSMEMTKSEVTLRCLSAYLGCGTDEVETLLKDNSFQPQVSEALKALKGLSVIDPSAPSWDDLKAWVRDTRQSGQQLDMVVLDHLKLMTRKGMYSRGEVERIGQLAEDAKRFAKEADVELVVIHQAGRSLEGNNGQKNHGDTPLTMEDLMYGGEQDADGIIGLFRPEKNPELSAGERSLVSGRMYMQLLKNRNGPIIYEGVECTWQKPSLRVVERASS